MPAAGLLIARHARRRKAERRHPSPDQPAIAGARHAGQRTHALSAMPVFSSSGQQLKYVTIRKNGKFYAQVAYTKPDGKPGKHSSTLYDDPDEAAHAADRCGLGLPRGRETSRRRRRAHSPASTRLRRLSYKQHGDAAVLNFQLEDGERRRLDGMTLEDVLAEERRKGEDSQLRKRTSGSSSFLGVSWDKLNNKWRAKISIDGKMKSLGYFDTEEEAARCAGGCCLARSKLPRPPLIIGCPLPHPQHAPSWPPDSANPPPCRPQGLR